MFDPDGDAWAGTHWHAYIEIANDSDLDPPSTREERLTRTPDHVLCDPDSAAHWMADMLDQHGARTQVRLIDGGGTGHTGDADHQNHDFVENHEVLHRGDSVYQFFHHHDKGVMCLWVEAVSNNECREVHDNTRKE